jgi:hypothetical protein
MLTLGQILLLKLYILSLHKVLVLVLCNLELLMVYKNILIVKGNKTISGFVVEPLYHTNVTGHLILVIVQSSLYYFIITICRTYDSAPPFVALKPTLGNLKPKGGAEPFC